MPYEIRVVVGSSAYLQIRLTGHFSGADVDRGVQEMMEHVLAKGLKGLLVDVRRLLIETTPADDFFFGQALADAGFRHIGRIALLLPASRRSEGAFFEDSCRNQGLPLRVFIEDETAARDWLGGETRPDGSLEQSM